jgi:preprotein translocase subunit SecY
MKHKKWIAIIAIAVILCIFLAEAVSKVLGISTGTTMLIICSVAFPVMGFAYDCIRLTKIRK